MCEPTEGSWVSAPSAPNNMPAMRLTEEARDERGKDLFYKEILLGGLNDRMFTPGHYQFVHCQTNAVRNSPHQLFSHVGAAQAYVPEGYMRGEERTRHNDRRQIIEQHIDTAIIDPLRRNPLSIYYQPADEEEREAMRAANNFKPAHCRNNFSRFSSSAFTCE